MNSVDISVSDVGPFAQRLAAAGGVRSLAANAFAEVGLPGTKDEAFHYTSLRSLNRLKFIADSVVPSDAELESLIDNALPSDGSLASATRIVFVNGIFSEKFSTVSGLSAVSFTHGTQEEQHSVADNDLPLVLLNRALGCSTAELEVPEGTDAGTIVILSLNFGNATEGDEAPSFHPHLHVRVGKGASVTLAEMIIGKGVYLNNPVSVINVAKEASVTHTKLQRESADAFHLATVSPVIAERGTYNSFTLGFGAQLSRHEVHAYLEGAGSAVHINGAQLLVDRQVGDITSVITHAAPNCISRQTVRNVLADRARGVFQGKVFVERIAQKTDGYQMNQALLLSETAEMNAKPELEIYADDVKCSHGATVGALDDDQLFYLCSRGIPDAEARRILVEAFLIEAVGLVEVDDVRAALEGALSAALVERIGATTMGDGSLS
ncbi:MAG: Fe-S cluster assembly protein SufD [Acetobacter sp.]|nr:Fe-S cluster assembly protein SufD [Acetobacter sp.]